jgi:hypothetical protein
VEIKSRNKEKDTRKRSKEQKQRESKEEAKWETVRIYVLEMSGFRAKQLQGNALSIRFTTEHQDATFICHVDMTAAIATFRPDWYQS